jgi:hypothetical protein
MGMSHPARSTANRATVGSMSRKKKMDNVEIPNPLRVDEAEFTDVIRKMVNTSPVTREEVEKHSKRRRAIERRKNPETDPRYLPVFDFSTPITPEQRKEIELKQRLMRKYKREQKKKS